MALIRGVFIDLDDTLVGTREANYRAYRRACQSGGLELTRAAFAANWGRDSRSFLPEVFDGLPIDAVERIRDEKKRVYVEELASTRVNAPLVDFVRSLPDVVVVLVTTAKRENAEGVIELHGLGGLFHHRVFGDDVSLGKPSPECYLRALELAGLDAASAVAFEDSDHGIASATAAGVATIRVEYFA
jgi:HAD superfamily hydrolase (TIGR01509 family)